jgi:hypothetical protein
VFSNDHPQVTLTNANATFVVSDAGEQMNVFASFER